MRAWLCVLTLCVASCKKDSPPPPPAAAPTALTKAPDDAFWAWVGQHLAELKAVRTGQEAVAAQLAVELRKVNPGLAWELGRDASVLELVISADGKQELFPVVKALVAKAPPLAGVKVTAFRPRKPATKDITSDRGTLSVADLSFAPLEDQQKPGLIALVVSVRGLTPENKDVYENMAFALLEALVGEYDIETRIGGIEFVPTEQSPAPGAKPVTELPAFVDGWGQKP